jgi:hypothetical protein
MKIFQSPSGQWVLAEEMWGSPQGWREINTDPTVAHTIEIDSCNAVITKDSCYFRDAAAPVLTLEEMQRVTRCMEMLKEAGE